MKNEKKKIVKSFEDKQILLAEIASLIEKYQEDFHIKNKTNINCTTNTKANDEYFSLYHSIEDLINIHTKNWKKEYKK